jgi:hypothetical protein
MKSLKKFIQTAKVLAFTLLLVISCFPTAAMALSLPREGDFLGLPQSVPIVNGSFDVSVTGTLKEDTRIGGALISLPPSAEIGVIEKIIITGPEGNIEYGCQNQPVETGIDLIMECGGPAYLMKGATTYTAKGSGFKPELKTTLTVDLQALYLD